MGQIIYREYIVFRGSNISCSLAFMRCGSGTESGCAMHSHHFVVVVVVVTLDTYQQLPKFPSAGNRDEGQLRKIELGLYEVVVGTVFRPLFSCIVQPKALLFLFF